MEVLPRHKWPKSLSSMEDQVVPLERNLYGRPLAGLLWERPSEEVLSELEWEKKVPNWECLFVHRKQGFSVIGTRCPQKMNPEQQNMALMWKKLMKNNDLDEPTSIFDHVCLGCTQR